jgi:diguanylate cyclase (GGDEF)-like protein/putative nucleotidyltransferase with HDIG domain
MAAPAAPLKNGLSVQALFFVGLTLAAGVTVPMLLIGDWRIHPTWGFAAYLAFALMASQWKVRIPGMNGAQTVLLFAVVFGFAEMSPVETLAVALAGTFFQCVWKTKARPTPVQVAFNVAVAAVAVSTGSYLYHFPALRLTGIDPAFILMLAASLMWILNTAPTAGIIALVERRPFLEVWRGAFFWNWPFYLVGAVLTEAAEFTSRHFGWHIAVLISPVVYVAFRGYKVFIGRMEDEKRHSDELSALHLRTIEALALAIEAKDHTTASHLARVQTYAMAIGEEIGMNRDQLDALRAASILHDIGKLAVPEYIISKPGKLTPEEFEKMKIHPVVGAEILERVKFPYPVTPMVRAHHEKWNGTGYPDGLKGEAIPLGARILSVVDCLDAMASDRQYRKALPLDEAMAHVEREAGISFDPKVVAILKRRHQELEKSARDDRNDRPALSVDVPVKVGGAPAAGFENSAEKPRTDHQVRTINFIAAIAAARQEMLDLFEICQDLGASLSLQETLSVFDVRLKRLVAFDCMAVYLTGNFTLTPEYVRGENSHLFASLQIPFGSGLSGWVAENAKAIVNGNPAVEPGYLNDATKFTTMRSALAVPLLDGENVIAVLSLYSAEREAFSGNNLHVLESLAGKLGNAISASLQLRRAGNNSLVDPLTGIGNARALLLHLDAELARCSRNGVELTLVVGDLDGFTAINGKLGHQAGNDVLKRVGARLRECSRPYDFVARTGADHFAVVISELNAGSIDRRVAEFHAAIEGIRTGAGRLLTMTAGVSTSGPDGRDAEQLLSIAEQRVHLARQSRDVSREACFVA